jgi:hypothetical protein
LNPLLRLNVLPLTPNQLQDLLHIIALGRQRIEDLLETISGPLGQQEDNLIQKAQQLNRS